MTKRSMKFTAILLCILFFLPGCVDEEGLAENETNVDCQIIPEGEYHVFRDNATQSSGEIKVLQSIIVEDSENSIWSDYVGECFIVRQFTQVQFVDGVSSGTYTMVDHFGNTFIDHRVIRGTTQYPTILEPHGTENNDFVMVNLTGELLENKSYTWTLTNAWGDEFTQLWVPCQQCFDVHSIGTFNVTNGEYINFNPDPNNEENNSIDPPHDHNNSEGNGTHIGNDSHNSTDIEGCSLDEGLIAPPSGMTQINLTQDIGGVTENRTFYIDVPEQINSSQCYPVVFALHGKNGMPQDLMMPFGTLVDEHKFIAVFPKGWNSSWNLGREPSTADDVAFITEITHFLSNYSNIDDNRRYLFGNSNGGGLSHRLAIETPLFRAFVSEVTMLTEDFLPNENSTHPAVMQILGADDHLVPYEGGEGIGGHMFLHADESAYVWAQHNNCTNSSNFTLEDGTVQTIYDGCVNGTHVVNYKVANAKHGIHPSFRGDKIRYIWDFFNSH